MTYTNKIQQLIDKGYTHHYTVHGRTLLSGGKKYWCLFNNGSDIKSLVTEEYEAALEFFSGSLSPSEMEEVTLGKALQAQLGSLSDKAMVHPSRPSQAILWTSSGWLHLGALGDVTQHNSREEVWNEFSNFNHLLDTQEPEALEPSWFVCDKSFIVNP